MRAVPLQVQEVQHTWTPFLESLATNVKLPIPPGCLGCLDIPVGRESVHRRDHIRLATGTNAVVPGRFSSVRDAISTQRSHLSATNRVLRHYRKREKDEQRGSCCSGQ